MQLPGQNELRVVGKFFDLFSSKTGINVMFMSSASVEILSGLNFDSLFVSVFSAGKSSFWANAPEAQNSARERKEHAID